MRRLAGLVLLCLPLVSVAGGPYSRNLDCDRQVGQRAREICLAVERELEWTWTGHAIVSPGYRATIEGATGVYCQLPITPRDTATLVGMVLDAERRRSKGQAQLNNASRTLLKLLGRQALDNFPGPGTLPDGVRRSSAQSLKDEIALAISEASMTIFAPSHTHYVLRDGCPVQPLSGRGGLIE